MLTRKATDLLTPIYEKNVTLSTQLSKLSKLLNDKFIKELSKQFRLKLENDSQEILAFLDNLCDCCNQYEKHIVDLKMKNVITPDMQSIIDEIADILYQEHLLLDKAKEALSKK